MQLITIATTSTLGFQNEKYAYWSYVEHLGSMEHSDQTHRDNLKVHGIKNFEKKIF